MVVTRTQQIKKIVCKNDERKYYRFRSAKFYGGIATADCVGCNLDCAFCWSRQPRKKPKKVGEFYSPQQIVHKLVNIAQEQRYSLVRISGNEPTLGQRHLLRILELLPQKYRFILETNGVLLDDQYVKELSSFTNVHVRVSLKAVRPKLFSKVTGASKGLFERPFQTLRLLETYDVSYHVSIVKDMLESGDLSVLKDKLVHLSARIEFESLRFYPPVVKEMRARGLNSFIKTEQRPYQEE